MPIARARRLLEQAADAFAVVAINNPADEEAVADQQAIAGFLDENEDDTDLDEALRAMFA